MHSSGRSFRCCSALVGALLTRVRDIRRGAKLVRASLIEAVKPYLGVHRRDQLRPDRFFLDDTLARLNGALAPESSQFPRRRWRRRPPEAEVPAVYWDLNGVWDSDALTALSARAKGLGDRFARWQRLDAAYGDLDTQL